MKLAPFDFLKQGRASAFHETYLDILMHWKVAEEQQAGTRSRRFGWTPPPAAEAKEVHFSAPGVSPNGTADGISLALDPSTPLVLIIGGQLFVVVPCPFSVVPVVVS